MKIVCTFAMNLAIEWRVVYKVAYVGKSLVGWKIIYLWRSSRASVIRYFRYFLERYKDTIFPGPLTIGCIYEIHLMPFFNQLPSNNATKAQGTTEF